MYFYKRNIVFLSFVLCLITLQAQDSRSQIPPLLQKSYFEVNIGAINHPFGQQHLENGFKLLSAVSVPPTSVRLVLFGYEFNKYLSAQITYMRPVIWVHYGKVGMMADNTNTPIVTNSSNNTVRMNVGGLTLKPTLPLSNNFSIYGEVGLGTITRNGFEDVNNNPIVKNVNYATFLFGAGVKYHVSNRWALQLCANYSPESKANKQPLTTFIGSGFSYNFRTFTPERLKKAVALGYKHPKQWLQIGYTSNVLGYGVNNAVSGKIPIFWGGEAEVESGVHLTYQRNVFHGPKVFSLDWGINASSWQSKGVAANNFTKEKFFTLSIFPVFRLSYWHAKKFDAYFYYSVAGPTYISKTKLDNEELGGHFTFQDNMGTGVFFGENRNLNAEIRIGHYSNGNTHVFNEAVKIPLSLNVGYAF
ncbi:MAG: acyloxyacyl hydrolase [Paludibacter sp.]